MSRFKLPDSEYYDSNSESASLTLLPVAHCQWHGLDRRRRNSDAESLPA